MENGVAVMSVVENLDIVFGDVRRYLDEGQRGAGGVRQHQDAENLISVLHALAVNLVSARGAGRRFERRMFEPFYVSSYDN